MRAMMFFLVMACAACGTARYQMELPKELKRFEESPGLKLISADGVRVKSRELDNYPAGDSEFWADATKVHLDQKGYIFKSKRCFDTQKKLRGCSVDFLVQHTGEDWVLSETIFAIGPRLIVIEAAGPYERMAPLEAGYAAALETFTPND